VAALRSRESRGAREAQHTVKSWPSWLEWGIAPLVLALAGVAVGHLRAEASRGSFYQATKGSAPTERAELEAAPALAAANAAWSFGPVTAVQKTSALALERLPESDGVRRARTFLRFGIVDANPDGQAALFAQACASNEGVCERMKEAAERETQARFVSPGNHLPLYFLGGHPPLPGAAP
jgi:hypothetical protein